MVCQLSQCNKTSFQHSWVLVRRHWLSALYPNHLGLPSLGQWLQKWRKCCLDETLFLFLLFHLFGPDLRRYRLRRSLYPLNSRKIYLYINNFIAIFSRQIYIFSAKLCLLSFMWVLLYFLSWVFSFITYSSDWNIHFSENQISIKCPMISYFANCLKKADIPQNDGAQISGR